MSQTLDQLEASAVQPSSAEPTIDEFAYKSIPPLAPVSALLGICALSGLLSPLGVLFAIFGAVLGFVALHQIDRSEGNLSGRKLAIVGTLTSAVLLVSGVAVHVYWFQTEVPPGYQRISFGLDISKKGFVMEDGQGRVHPDIAALEGKSLFVKGYMYPGTQLEDLSTFLLCRDNGDCCFGGQPKLTDMIKVKMTGDLKAHHMQHLVSVAGVFRLRDLRKAGNLEPAFELEATHFGIAKTSY
jgi:hypothetical protein